MSNLHYDMLCKLNLQPSNNVFAPEALVDLPSIQNWALIFPPAATECKTVELALPSKIVPHAAAPLLVCIHSEFANCVGWWPFQDDGTGQIAGTEAFAISGDSNIEAK